MKHHNYRQTWIKLLFFTVLCLLLPMPIYAQPVEIIAEGTYQMGDNDTPSIAEERALLKAKRNALEQAGTYITSSTSVKNLQVTEDNLLALSAGVLKVSIIDTQRTQIGNGMEIKVKIKALVDTDKLQELIKNSAEAPKLLSPASPDILPSSQQTSIQFNGYYQHTSMTKNLKWCVYYRFFPDGTVNAISYFGDTAPPPENLFEVLRLSPGGMGTYSMQNGEIQFILKYLKGKIEGKGLITGEKILLSFYSDITKTSGQQTCWFIRNK